jgi:hypothetical protein
VLDEIAGLIAKKGAATHVHSTVRQNCEIEFLPLRRDFIDCSLRQQ